MQPLFLFRLVPKTCHWRGTRIPRSRSPLDPRRHGIDLQICKRGKFPDRRAVPGIRFPRNDCVFSLPSAMFSSRRLVRSVLFSIAPGAAGGAVAARDIAGRHYYRPTDPKIAAKYAGQFPKVQLFRIDDVFGGWAKAQKTPFNDGGVFDQIYAKK